MLKEIEERERRVAIFVQPFRVWGRLVSCGNSIISFGLSEFVVSINEDGKNRVQRFNGAAKTTASAGEYRNIMPDVGVNSFYRKGIVFVVCITHMLSRKDNIHITYISIRTIAFRFQRSINHLLDPFRRLIGGYGKSNDLPWFSADHRYRIDIFTGFASSFSFNEPI